MLSWTFIYNLRKLTFFVIFIIVKRSEQLYGSLKTVSFEVKAERVSKK